MAFAASSWEMLFAVGAFLGGGQRSLAGGFSSGFLSFSLNISTFIRFVVHRVNGGGNFQVHQFIVDVIVGKVLLGLEVVDDIIHRLMKRTEEDGGFSLG